MILSIESIKQEYEATGDASAAISAYGALLAASVDDDSLRESILVERGMLHWRAGHRAEAINDYNAAIRLNSASQAVQLRESAYAILDFYNKDLYNP